MSQVFWHPTPCAAGHLAGNAAERQAANFDCGDFEPELLAARRRPDRIHHRAAAG